MTDPFAAPSGDQPAVPAQPTGYGAPAYGGQQPLYGEPPGSAQGQLAPWGTRVVGAVVDGAIIFVAQLLVMAVSKPAAQLVGLLINVYFAYLVGTKGQSPGKSLMKIKVVRDADGTLLGFGIALLREIAHILDVITLFLGFLWPLWDKKNQTFADKVVGSVVIRA